MQRCTRGQDTFYDSVRVPYEQKKKNTIRSPSHTKPKPFPVFVFSQCQAHTQLMHSIYSVRPGPAPKTANERATGRYNTPLSRINTISSMATSNGLRGRIDSSSCDGGVGSTGGGVGGAGNGGGGAEAITSFRSLSPDGMCRAWKQRVLSDYFPVRCVFESVPKIELPPERFRNILRYRMTRCNGFRFRQTNRIYKVPYVCGA